MQWSTKADHCCHFVPLRLVHTPSQRQSKGDCSSQANWWSALLAGELLASSCWQAGSLVEWIGSPYSPGNHQVTQGIAGAALRQW